MIAIGRDIFSPFGKGSLLMSSGAGFEPGIIEKNVQTNQTYGLMHVLGKIFLGEIKY